MLLAVAINNLAAAQVYRDTVFTFYFSTNKHTVDSAQQKSFEAFLKVVQKTNDSYSINGYTDTTGTKKYNKALAEKRAGYVSGLLPEHNGRSMIGIEGETTRFGLPWQNRRVDVIAILRVPSESKNAGKGTSSKPVAELNIENIIFIPDRPLLTEASYVYVQQLARQLQQYKSEKFQIIGHVNYQSKLPADRLKDMYTLSEARAKTVYQLLVQYGMDASRMSYKGVGNSQPLYPDPVNEEQKRANMRVQVLILH